MYSRLVKGFEPIVATCKGDYDDPMLNCRIIKFKRTLQSVLRAGGRCVLVDDVSPWNSIRIKLRLSYDASLRLRELAQQRSPLLADLGILSLQFETENQSYTIVDVPSSSSASYPGTGSSVVGSNQFTYLLGSSDHNEPKHGVRRALPHSESEFPPNAKVPKRASGIRRPRGSRSSRGSRGGSSQAAGSVTVGDIGTLDNSSVDVPHSVKLSSPREQSADVTSDALINVAVEGRDIAVPERQTQGTCLILNESDSGCDIPATQIPLNPHLAAMAARSALTEQDPDLAKDTHVVCEQPCSITEPINSTINGINRTSEESAAGQNDCTMEVDEPSNRELHSVISSDNHDFIAIREGEASSELKGCHEQLGKLGNAQNDKSPSAVAAPDTPISTEGS